MSTADNAGHSAGMSHENSGEAAPVSGSLSTAGMSRYLLTKFAVVALLYLLPFFLARTSLYERWNPSFYARPLNYAYKTAGQNADVVIFGDSTALLGINPSQMSSTLGVKVLNLVNTQPSLVVNDDLTLRRYLSQNKPPRLIVFYFAPWDFDYGHTNFNARPVYEGEEVLVSQGTASEILAFVRKRPMEAIVFPLRFYASGMQLMLHRVQHPNQEAQLTSTLGHVDTTDMTVLASLCQFPSFLIENIRFDWVKDLGDRFKSPQTNILFYAAPVPACRNVSEVMARPYDQLPVSPPKQVPADFFTNDVRYIHPRASAVPELTSNLTEEVRPLLKPPPAK